MLSTTIKYQHVILLDETNSGVEIYAKQILGYSDADSNISLLKITYEDSKYNINVLSDKVVIKSLT